MVLAPPPASLDGLSARLEVVSADVRRLSEALEGLTIAVEALASRLGPEPGTSQNVPAAATAAPKAAPGCVTSSLRKRFYVICRAREESEHHEGVPAGQVGIYSTYGAYANNVVEAAAYPHTGRGRLAFAEGSISEGFPTLGEAELFWSSHFPNTRAPRVY